MDVPTLLGAAIESQEADSAQAVVHGAERRERVGGRRARPRLRQFMTGYMAESRTV